MKLSYFELISPDPVQIQNVGGILSPKLRDISKIGINIYQFYLSFLSMDAKSYFSMLKQQEVYDSLSDDDKAKIDVYDIMTKNKETIRFLQESLNFFINENVIWSDTNKCFLVNKDMPFEEDGKIVEKPITIGIIAKQNYYQICDLIFQRNAIRTKRQEDLSKVKSKKALDILKKLQKGREEKSKTSKVDKNMELGNIISAVANKSNSLNIITIWDLTVYQVWDCFSRLSNNSIYDIQSMSIATWGDKDNHFDATAWFKRIDDNN